MTINILFLAAEAEPFIKIGGLGDVAGALPRAIQKASQDPTLPDVDIRVVLPYHYAIKQKHFEPAYLGDFKVKKAKGAETCKVYRSDQGPMPVYLLDGDPIDAKSPVYSPDPVRDGYKFVFFSVAALGLADFLNWRVDILHCNDWHTAIAIYALKKLKPPSQYLRHTKTLHTLHNLPYMGFGVQDALTAYALPPSQDSRLPEWARHASLPLGLLSADQIVPVSPHYAKEVLTPEFGCGLENFLATRQDALTGILNGLDTATWNPENDPAVAAPFSTQTLGARSQNKASLIKQLNLNPDESVPLLTLVSRMDPQKGIDIALKGLRQCVDQPWQAILLGTGIPGVEAMAKQLEADFPERVRVILAFDSRLAHQLYAGADLFMMPSRYEPCGLSQMIAMHYGCVPVARATGGLVDTIRHVGRKVNGGTGFLFEKPYPSSFARILKRAFRFYQQPASWQQIQKNGMQIDFSWDHSARQYLSIFQELMANQPSE